MVDEHVRRAPGTWSWTVLERPDAADLARVGRTTGLDVDALEREWRTSTRPSLAVVGDAALVGHRLARYRSEYKALELFDVLLAFGPNFVVVVTEDADLVRPLGEALAGADGAGARGPVAVFEASGELLVDNYLDVIDGLDTDIKQVEKDIFARGSDNPVEQIYRLRRSVADLEELVTRLNEEPHARVVRRRLPAWASDDQDPDWFESSGPLADLDRQFDRMVTRVQAQRGLLDSVLNADLVQVGIQQNTDMRKISAWVAIAAIPAGIGGVYGMNFEHMPELTWRYGYPVVLVLIASACAFLYWRLRKNGWL